MKFRQLLSSVKFEINRYFQFNKADNLLKNSIQKKECYFGPFVGEFGHLLSHVIPFISYLNELDVKVNYMGPEIHKPLFKSSKSSYIINNYEGLRDFYSEVSPDCNNQYYPDDIGEIIEKFKLDARNSGLPFWDISSRKFYWIGFCKWMYERNHYHTYSFNNFLKKNQITIFARKKGDHSPVRGSNWNFQSVINKIIHETNLDIKVLGHPAFSHNFKSSERVKVILTSDNQLILDECKKSKFIINQLSGTHYLGIYCDTPVILLMKGPDIDYSNFIKDLNYRLKLNPKSKIQICSTENELIKYLKL